MVTKWENEIIKIKPYIYKIHTPNGSGTGFQIFKNSQNICGVATAYHVISHAYEWEESIKLTHSETGSNFVLKCDPNIRAIYVYPDKDLAFIIFHNNEPFSDDNMPKLTDSTDSISPGAEIGWIGFPAVAADNLCFFSGHISFHLEDIKSYLVDGVAINGVSGAPAFLVDPDTGELKICGVISNYFPNRTTGEALPGLSMIRSVETYQEDLEKLKSIDEANRQKTLEENQSV